jgi:hypothetical protein
MRNMKNLLLAAVVAGGCVSCGDVVRNGRGSTLLVVDMLTGIRGGNGGTTETTTLLSDVLTIVTSPAPCSATTPCPTVFNDLGQVTLRNVPKNVVIAGSPLGPTTNSDITISRYRVSYRRSDGRNRQGVDVPYTFDGAATGTVPVGGTLGLGFELVRHIAKQESPLVQLSSSPTIITTIADVTFFGSDVVGNEISVTGSIQVDFGNFGDGQ